MLKIISCRILMQLALFILVSYAALSKPISLEEAKEIAMQHNLQMNKYSTELQDPSAYRLIASSHDIFSNSTKNPTFYIYNFPQKGWVIVAGDDIARPILAYSKDASYSLENIPDNAKYWLEIYDNAISEAIKQGAPQSEKIANEWLIARNPKKRNSLLDEIVPPLIKTNWSQDSPYNDLCPYDEDEEKRTYTGCVATSMAQIMKYWNFPVSGIGKKTYTHYKYGALYADFENTTYDWDNMTNIYNHNSTAAQKTAVATLMYHCGVALSMDYGAVVGSFACSQHIATSLINYFMYDTNVRIISRYKYDDNTWTDILKENLDNNQPIEYSGRDNYYNAGHSFVCDGYDTDGRFHFNLGRNGNSNGYYYIDNITNLKLNLKQNAIVNIKPIKELYSQVALLKPLELKQEVVYQNSSIKINANIVNNSSESFSGSLSLRLFDAENNFLITIAEQEIDELESNQPIEITFETNPLFNTSVGKYYVKLYYKHDISHKWLLSSGNNKLKIDVQKPLSSESKLSLYSLPTLSAYQIDKEKDSTLKVTASFINTSKENFAGIISASIYDEKGTIIKELASYNITEAVAPNNQIKDIEFFNTILDLDYGIYFIGFSSKDEEGKFAFINTNNFISFIKFEIVPPELITDSQLKKWISDNKKQLFGIIINEAGGITGTTKNLEALSKIENLDCTNSKLVSIDELIQHMPNLKTLRCYRNSLIELDVSKNTRLEKLDCSENRISNLDLSKNIKLEKLDCYNNQLSNLALSKNTELTYLKCNNNKLTNLDISRNIKLKELYCWSNQLNKLDISKNIEIMYLNCTYNQLINLDVSKNIELKELHCYSNQLTNLDLSENIKLEKLDCYNNQLNKVDISKNTELTYLKCNNNKLTNLDISRNIKLKELDCYNNQLTNLQLSKNIELTLLNCDYNQLTNLDISKNIKLEKLDCYNNQLNKLDVSKNIKLKTLFCNNNTLNSLDISPLPNLLGLNCCNQAEGFILYLTNKQKNKFSVANYCNAILEEKDGNICEIEWLDIYPNPTTGKFFIESKFFSDEIKILNLAGEILYRTILNDEKTEIDISNLPAGVYLVITKGKIGKVVKN
ncbi:MAG: T9SS type A sorting domain-containing protein [Ignavibacteria bacterium]|jgi:Leucine-rich repeat (LRR) protein|nr:T9SS type A sorting domain-containing protein [Ignavibacteria bacterium]